MKYLFLYLLLMFVFNIGLHAQNQMDARLELKKASENYEKGQYQQAIEFLEKNHENCGYNTADLQNAYKILISSFHELDEVEKEMEFTKKFIKLDPVYAISYSSDPAPFISAMEKFKIGARWTIHASIGTNLLKPQILASYPIWDVEGMTSTYIHSFGFTVLNPELEFSFNEHYSIISGININVYGFDRKISAPNNFSEVYTESVVEVKIPLLLSYKFHLTKKLSIAPLLGAYTSVLGANATITSSASSDTKYNKSKSLVLTDSRNNMNYGFTFGGTLQYKPSRWAYTLTITDSHDFLNYTKPATKDLTELTTDFYYIDDALRLSNLCIRIGLSFDISYFIKPKY